MHSLFMWSQIIFFPQSIWRKRLRENTEDIIILTIQPQSLLYLYLPGNVIFNNAWIQRNKFWRTSTIRDTVLLLLKSLLERAYWCLMFVRGSADLFTSSSRKCGLIREDSSLAETFLLIRIHRTKNCWAFYSRGFSEALPALNFWHTSSWRRAATWAHVKPRHMRLFPNDIILFSPSLSLSLFCLSVDLASGILFMWPGSCQQGSLADCRGAWNVKGLFLGLRKNTKKLKLRRESGMAHTEQRRRASDP